MNEIQVRVETTDGLKGEDESKQKSDAVKQNATVSKTSAIILVLALGVHSLFEGIAFGLITEVEEAG